MQRALLFWRISADTTTRQAKETTMRSILRWILAIVAGLLLGSLVNSGVLALGARLLPPPAGVDMNSMAGLQAALPGLPATYLLPALLAHALGTLCGAWLASRVLPPQYWQGAAVIGLAFLTGGAMMAWSLPAPLWFELLDLVLAYLPMAWLGHWLARHRYRRSATHRA